MTPHNDRSSHDQSPESYFLSGAFAPHETQKNKTTQSPQHELFTQRKPTGNRAQTIRTIASTVPASVTHFIKQPTDFSHYRPWMNPWILFWRDLRSVITNSIGLIIVLGLIIVPSLYTWFNVGGEMNLYAHTSSLEVAIANTDQGYQSSLIPVRIDIGETLSDDLRNNKNFDWQFTTEQQAINGVKDGTYYAAIIIPSNFSATMMTLFSQKVKHAELDYYTNEKLNPIAPKLITEGADDVRTDVNTIFTKAITTIGLGLAETLGHYMDSTNASLALNNLDTNLSTFAQQLTAAGTLLGSYQSIIQSAQNLASTTSSLLTPSGTLKTDAQNTRSTAVDTIQKAATQVNNTSTTISQALADGSKAFQTLASAIQKVNTNVQDSSHNSAQQVQDIIHQVEALRERYQSVQQAVTTAEKNLPTTSTSSREEQAVTALKAKLAGVAAALSNAVLTLQTTENGLQSIASSLSSAPQSAAALQQKVTADLQSAETALSTVQHSFGQSLVQQLTQLAANAQQAGDLTVSTVTTLNTIASQASSSTQHGSQQLGHLSQTLLHAQTNIDHAAQQLTNLSNELHQALKNKDMAQVKALLSESPSTLSNLITSPVKINQHSIYPVANFGNAIGPFYAVLAMWIGCVLDIVAIKPRYSLHKTRGLSGIKPRHLYFGRQISITFISLLQCLLIAAGCLFYLRMQMVRPWMFLLLSCVCALVFSTITYSLMSFGNAGKMIAELLLILQITAAGGTYPVEVMPKFYQILSRFLPATHAITAMRYCVGGFYGWDYWKQLLYLLSFIIPSAFIIIVLRKPFRTLVKHFTEKTEKAGLII